MVYPRMMRIRQHFQAPRIDDVEQAVYAQLDKLQLSQQVHANDTVAITAGSRGIANIALIIKTLVRALKHYGAKPFIVPAMGSHGGGTVEGQLAILQELGITEEYTGAEIKATMDVTQIGETKEGFPVFFDRLAYQADHVVVVNRVKPHSDFVGEIESGLHKMLLIGLGKHRGASLYHKAFVHYNFDQIIRSVSQIVLKQCHILFGLAIVENQRHETALIEVVQPCDFFTREKMLLQLSKEWMPRLPFSTVDLLIVDYIGKNISGSGMDTNVIGRKPGIHQITANEFPRITRIYARDLTEETHGNATGIGLADFAHAQIIAKMDKNITYTNCITSNGLIGAFIPIHYATDRKVLENAFQTLGLVEPEQAKVIRIHNTLELDELLVSEAYLAEIQQRSDVSILEPAHEIQFTKEGNLLPFYKEKL